jgi:hypothetical protein
VLRTSFLPERLDWVKIQGSIFTYLIFAYITLLINELSNLLEILAFLPDVKHLREKDLEDHIIDLLNNEYGQ